MHVHVTLLTRDRSNQMSRPIFHQFEQCAWKVFIIERTVDKKHSRFCLSDYAI